MGTKNEYERAVRFDVEDINMLIDKYAIGTVNPADVITRMREMDDMGMFDEAIDLAYSEITRLMAQDMQRSTRLEPTMDFTIIAEEWALDTSGVTETEPLSLSITLPSKDVVKYWQNQTRWMEPTVGENFASELEGPFEKLAQKILYAISDDQNIKVYAYSSIVRDS
jgi:hypothetical protein